MLGKGGEGKGDMSADVQRRLRLVLILLLLLFGCSTVDKDAANFSKSQKLRKHALMAARQGDTSSALEYIDQVQVLEPRTSRLPALTPPYLSGPEHRTIAPAGGPTTCSSIGINRFYCF